MPVKPLERGASEVRHLIRREKMPTINKLMGIGSYGFTCGFPELSHEWRWRFMQYSTATQTPAPHESVLRVSRHEHAYFHFGKTVVTAEERQGVVHIAFADDTALETDFLLLGTGFTIDPMARTEFGESARDILLWEDVYEPPPGEECPELARFPYLGPDFTFRERVPGTAPWVKNVYCFNHGATASLGKVSGETSPPCRTGHGCWRVRSPPRSMPKTSGRIGRDSSRMTRPSWPGTNGCRRIWKRGT